ncbi:MAG: hypothetical protein KBC64_07790, partial [Simkaniaceae bacterium]|nr:hypothetical protein [Simkaniaceae bacterium]
YTLLIQEYAGDEDRYIERGLVYLLKGNREAALLDLRKAESIEMPYYLDRCDSLFIPKSTYIIEWINTRFPVAETAPSEIEQAIFQAETFYNQGDCISAIAILEPMVTGQSMGNIEKQKIVDLLGRAYFELGNFEKAAEFFAMYQEPSFLREVCRLYFEQYQEIAITDDIISLALLMKGVNLGNRLVLHPELQGIEKLFFNDYEQFRIAADSLWKGPVFNDRRYLYSWLWTAYYLGPKAYPHVGNIESERRCALGAFCRGDREKAFRDLSVVEAGERANYGKWGSIPTTPFIVQLLNRV